MFYKIAAASTDGKVINQHFGRTEKFYIIGVEDSGEYHYLETRETFAACQGGSHDEDALAHNVELLSDCKYVLVSQIGPGAEYALSKKGVTAFAIAHYIDEAVKKLIHYQAEIKQNSK